MNEEYSASWPEINYREHGVSVALVRKTKKDDGGNSGIYWRVTHTPSVPKQRFYFTGTTFYEDEWIDFISTNKQKYRDLKKMWKEYFENVLKKNIEQLVKEGSFSINILNGELKKGNTDSVNDAFKAKIDDLVENNKIGNSEIYQTAFNALQRFKHYKSLKGEAKVEFIKQCIENKNVTRGENKIEVKERNIPFAELTPQFLKECDRFWRDTEVSTSTIAMRMRTIRAIVKNDEKPYLKDRAYPFGKGKYLIPSSTRKQDFYPIEDIWQLEEYETDHPAKELAKAIFIFMFYGSGINFKDFCLLKYSHITYDRELKFYREKMDTDSGNVPQPVYVPLLPPMIEIINKHGNKEQNGYIFPFLNGIEDIPENEAEIKRLNRRDLDPININLKIIAAELGLNTEISTNWARHSYMTHLLSELMLNETVVKQMVGHSVKDNVTSGYNHLTPKKRFSINSQLINPHKKYNTIGRLSVTG